MLASWKYVAVETIIPFKLMNHDYKHFFNREKSNEKNIKGR